MLVLVLVLLLVLVVFALLMPGSFAAFAAFAAAAAAFDTLPLPLPPSGLPVVESEFECTGCLNTFCPTSLYTASHSSRLNPLTISATVNSAPVLVPTTKSNISRSGLLVAFSIARSILIVARPFIPPPSRDSTLTPPGWRGGPCSPSMLLRRFTDKWTGPELVANPPTLATNARKSGRSRHDGGFVVVVVVVVEDDNGPSRDPQHRFPSVRSNVTFI